MIIDDIKNSIKSSYNGIKKGTLDISKLSSYNKSNRPTVLRMPTNNNSKIRQIIHYLCENKQPFENYKFLILLSDDYFSRKIKILPTRKYYIKKIPFPGKLQIEKYSEMKYNTTKYSFESNPVPNQLYIKLQKEQIYVLYSEYEYKLLESQFNEFYDILTLIGAKYIKMSKIIKNLESSNSNFSTEIGLNTVCENAKISNKVSMKNEKDTALLLTQEMSFNNDKDPELNKIIDNNYYYLPNQMDLQSLIIRRIENNQTNDKYTYIHTENNLINRKILTKLSKLNIGNSLSINFDYSFKQVSNFQIEYIIEFYNIKNKNLNKIRINEDYEDNEKPWLMKIINKFINEYCNN